MLKRTIKDLKKYLPFSIKMAKYELKAEVAGSYLNWLWWIITPLCFMFLYTFVFGYVFDASEPYFPIFIFIGIAVWDFFRSSITNSVNIIKRNKMIISRVYMPKYILLFIQIWKNAFKMMISFGIVFIMMAVYSVPISINVLYFIPVLFTIFCITFGTACFVMHYGVFIADMANVMSLFLRMLMYLTGIFYNVETRIPDYGAILNACNPMAFLISSMRKCMIYEIHPDIIYFLFWIVIGIGLSWFGIRKIYKEENGYLKVI